MEHLALDADAIADICDGLTADRIVIVGKDTEVKIVDAVIKQLGLSDRLQGLVTFSDLQNWHRICLGTRFRVLLLRLPRCFFDVGTSCPHADCR